jgi:hypothetical protein
MEKTATSSDGGDGVGRAAAYGVDEDLLEQFRRQL